MPCFKAKIELTKDKKVLNQALRNCHWMPINDGQVLYSSANRLKFIMSLTPMNHKMH